MQYSDGMTIDDCKITDLPKFPDARGNLSFVENHAQIPFEIKRTYWLYDVPGGVSRGGHAEISNEELVIALSGAFDITVDDGKQSRTFTLNRSYRGLYIPKGLWREIKEFSTNAVALEFGSVPYDVNDYIRDYGQFLQYAANERCMVAQNADVKPVPVASDTRRWNVDDCTMMELGKHHSDRKGNITVVENASFRQAHGKLCSVTGTLPFDVKRVYYLYDVPGGENRGSHAHRDLEQLIVAASGSFRVTLDDGHGKRSFFLSRPYQGLYVKPGMWRELEDFSSGAVCMVLASGLYDEEDYISDYKEFVKFRNK